MTNEYLAGFVDGEGYLGIRKHNNPQNILGFRYQAVVKIAQREKDRKVLDIIKSKYGGYISPPRNHSDNSQDSVMWEISNNKAVPNFLNDIRKYLIVKKPQAEVLRQFVSLGNITTRIPGNFEARRNFIYEKRRLLYEQILILNKRGVAETERSGLERVCDSPIIVNT